MRINSGQYRGRILKVPPGMEVRPTADKVRQAVFNILFGFGYPEGARVLDGFCGTGALGLEALSRGATHCVFVDSAEASLACCRANIAMVRAEEASATLRLAMALLGKRPAHIAPVQLFFLDPPYRKALVPSALAALAAGGWLEPGAFGVVETAQDEDALAQGYAPFDTRTYGSTRVTFLRYDAPPEGGA